MNHSSRVTALLARLPMGVRWRLLAAAEVEVFRDLGRLLAENVSATSRGRLEGEWIGSDSSHRRPTERELMAEFGQAGHWGEIITSIQTEQCRYALVTMGQEGREWTQAEVAHLDHHILACHARHAAKRALRG